MVELGHAQSLVKPLLYHAALKLRISWAGDMVKSIAGYLFIGHWRL